MRQLKNVDGKGHRNRIDRNASILWAKNLVEKDDWYILDTETTGTSDTDEIIELAVIDCAGDTVMHTRMNPKKRKIHTEAQATHGITLKDLKGSPTFVDLHPEFHKHLHNKRVIAYNCNFDSRMIAQTMAVHAIKHNTKIRFECAMLKYSAFVGEWNDKHQSYKYQKLPGADHGALNDCKATLELIHALSEAKYNHSFLSGLILRLFGEK